MSEVYLLSSKFISPILQDMIDAALEGRTPVVVNNQKDIPDLRDKEILFALELNNAGIDQDVNGIISILYDKGNDSLSGSKGALVVRSPNELYTKNAAQGIIFLANMLGCSFPGHPVVEATANLCNFLTWQKQTDIPLKEICADQCRKLGNRLMADISLKLKRPDILVLHSSERKTSNTLKLWHTASNYITSCRITELHVENGDVYDCKGCSYKTCIHFSKQRSCFYGGVVVRDIYPALERADAVVWVCPNYNDAVSANLAAVINRLTALYRKISFYNKSIFSVIVSGNSGSDSVARQLIGSLCINKGFRLPPYFALMERANDAGEILKKQGMEDKAKSFAENMMIWMLT